MHVPSAVARHLSSARRPSARTGLVIALVLLALPALSVARQWGGTVYWETDALFYQAMLLQVRGVSESASLERTFQGPMAARARSLDADEPGEPARVTRPEWVRYSTQFYERRWLLPAIGAGLTPLLGEHSLETLSLLGYCLLCPLLFLLLRRRVGRGPALVAALACIALPPLRNWTLYPLTDSWGLMLIAAGLLAGLMVIERGPRWLLPWALCVCALAFTRDLAFVLVVAAGMLALVLRTRRSLLLTGVAVVASLPAPLIWSVPMRELLAYLSADIDIPRDSSWSFVLGEYLPRLGDAAEGYADYATTHPLVVLAFVAGLIGLFLLSPARDPLALLLKGTVLAYVVFLAIGPTFSDFRYELILLPAVAYGFGLLVERAWSWITERAPRLSASRNEVAGPAR